jgi:hypothetical protein
MRVKECHIPNKSMAYWVNEYGEICFTVGDYEFRNVGFCMVCGKRLEKENKK